MRIKIIIAAAAISISGAFATTAAADAATRTPTKVTIKGPSGDFYGYVKSADEDNCANGRKVILYKLTGDTPNPSADEKIGSDTASPNGDRYMWSTGNTGERNGKFYARVRKTDDCGGDISPVISL